MAGKRTKPDYEKLTSGNYLQQLGLQKGPQPTGDAPTSDPDGFEISNLTGDPAAPVQIPGVTIPTTARADFSVEIALIRRYERNPRQTPNSKYEAIRDSILVDGLENPLDLTKRPHDAHFVLAKGGNTRLTALNDIIANYDALCAAHRQRVTEAGGAGKTPLPLAYFLRPPARFAPYVDELTIFSAHMRENENREGLAWFDDARARIEYKTMYEATKLGGQTMSISQLAQVMRADGFAKSCSIENLSRALFAVDKLSVVADQLGSHVITGKRVLAARWTYLAAKTIWTTRYPEGETADFEALIAQSTSRFLEQAHAPAHANDSDAEDGAGASSSPLDELQAAWRTSTEDAIGLDDDHRDVIWRNVELLQGKGLRAGHAADSFDLLVASVAAQSNPDSDDKPKTNVAPEAVQGRPTLTTRAPREKLDLATRRNQLITRLAATRDSLPVAVADAMEAFLDEDESPLTELIHVARNESESGHAVAREFLEYIQAVVSERP